MPTGTSSRPLQRKTPKAKTAPALPSGFRDWGPEDLRKRHRLFAALQETFERYGYEPLETPAVELLSVLTGKYGDEGEKLLFRILNSGNFLEGVPEEARASSQSLLPYIAEKALRYDLTVPMARWVAQNAGKLVFPFRRYQMQPVWRADRPQKGRFREFYQCDIDTIGARGLIPLLEIYQIAREVFEKLNLTGCVFHLNHRALLEALAEKAQWPGAFLDFCRLLDKTDKIGWEAVRAALQEQGAQDLSLLDPERPLSTEEIQRLPLPEEVRAEILGAWELVQTYQDDPILRMRWDNTLARGLDYYTGFIYEVKRPGSGVGTIAAGGAYASLVQEFGGPDLPAMGFSFGIERIYALLTDFEAPVEKPWLVAWTDATPLYIMEVVSAIQKGGKAAFAYPAPKRLSQQLEYAQRRGLPYVAIVGQTEETQKTVTLKNLSHGTQVSVALAELPQWAARV
jgi:histidyl-tRNA synthetase